MAKAILTTTLPLLLVLLLLLQTEASRLGREKLTHLHFYLHDIFTGPYPTAVQVASFGAIRVIDDPLTERPDPTSRLVGRAQGAYASTSSGGTMGLLMMMNLVLLEGKYNGSTLVVVGMNKPMSEVRELEVVGGTGAFRFARGYAEAKTYRFERATKNANVEYNVFVWHH
ncbi:hypothetical protein QJS04_geneDACA009167 [Acorus gramineus]|uniref:Dirigent protein n=1 Tax=Acorus gramineus TaxID=55184 RepID=A0AAV9AQM7_ACOGR|nr:hypothetical protein QJS04_geneDACA009167 [Acorus gramineus]